MFAYKINALPNLRHLPSFHFLVVRSLDFPFHFFVLRSLDSSYLCERLDAVESTPPPRLAPWPCPRGRDVVLDVRQCQRNHRRLHDARAVVLAVRPCCALDQATLRLCPRGHRTTSNPQPLGRARMKIVLGGAKGLAFLNEAEKPVTYRDFKTSNILLDEEYSGKLYDFGLAKDGPIDDRSHVSTPIRVPTVMLHQITLYLSQAVNGVVAFRCEKHVPYGPCPAATVATGR